MQNFFSLLRKDLALELRLKETLVLLFTLSLLLSAILSIGIGGAFLSLVEKVNLLPTFLWIIFVFTATLSVGRSYDYEFKHGALDGLLLTGVSPACIYLSKVISNFIIMTLGHLFTIVVLLVLLNIDLGLAVFSQILFLSLLVIFGYSALSTLLAAITNRSQLAHMLLPLILLPLLIPLLMAAIEATALVIDGQGIDPGSVWVSLLITLDLVYLVLGVSLYEYAVRE